MKIECPKHGEVEFNGTGDFRDDDIITMYCPKCVGEEQTKAIQSRVARLIPVLQEAFGGTREDEQ